MEILFALTFILIPLSFFALFVLSWVLWILMLVHAAQHKTEDQVLWILIIVLGGIVGAVVYYFVEYQKDQKKSHTKK